MKSKIVIATRYYSAQTKEENAHVHDGLSRWLTAAQEVVCGDAGQIVVALGAQDRSGAAAFLAAEWPAVKTVVVSPYTNIAALNALVHAAVDLIGPDGRLFISSTELAPTVRTVSTLSSVVEENVLVAGAAFGSQRVNGQILPGHDFAEGYVTDAAGDQVPWNTTALWNLRLLSRIGFVITGDGLFADDRSTASPEEEAVTIALLQRLLGEDRARALLLRMPWFDGQYDRTGWSTERLNRNADVLSRKQERVRNQLEALDLQEGPAIVHFDFEAAGLLAESRKPSIPPVLSPGFSAYMSPLK